MNFHSTAQPYLRPRANAHFFQQLSNQKVCPLWGDKTLLFSVGKMLLVFCPMLLTVHLWLASSFNNLHTTVQMGEIVQHRLMESQSSLKTKRDQMLLPERVRVIAAEKLALHVPEKEQMTFIK
jgi:hypothetical protein